MPKKTAKKKTTRQTKADFVRSQPATMPAKDVIAKAKERGMTLTEEAVYKTRSLDKKRAKGKSSGKAKAKTATAGTSGRARGKAPDKKNRVLELKAQNPNWTADQIAKAAKCSTTYVYSIWGGSKKMGGSTGTKPRAIVPSNGTISDFYRALKGVGVEKARELIAHYEAIQNA